MSDKATDLMERERLMDLVLASARQDVNPNTIPRILVSRDPVRLNAVDIDEPDDSVSPLAVLIVLAMLLGLFVAIVQL